MELIKIRSKDADQLASLVVAFRDQLRAYKGLPAQGDIDGGRQEILDFLNAGFPVYAVEEDGDFVAYLVCRTDEPCLWVEQLFVVEDYRRRGLAGQLFEKAEEIARSMGEDTVYNFVHPNNKGVIGFLRSRGYTVLNMIEIRKPYRGEKPVGKISVGKESFDY